MNLRNELIKKALQEGSTEERFFINTKMMGSKESDTMNLIRTLVHNLYEKGYTPAEVKGFLEFTSRCAIYQNPKLLSSQACDD